MTPSDWTRCRVAFYHGDGTGKRGPVHFEFEQVLVARRLPRIQAAAHHRIAHGHADAHIGAEPVGGIATDREPAGGIHQVREIRVDGSKLDAFHRRILLAREPAVIIERHGGGLPLGQRLGKAQPYGGFLLVARGGYLLALGVKHTRNVKRVIQLERGRVRAVFQRHEVHRGLDRNGLRVGGNFGFDDIVLHVDVRGVAAVLGGTAEGHAQQQQAGCQGSNRQSAEFTIHERFVPPESLE